MLQCSEGGIILQTSLTKEYIKQTKAQGNQAFIELIETQKDNTANLIFILENTGYLSGNFDPSCFISLLNNSSDNVRILALKNLAKFRCVDYLPRFLEIALTDKNTSIRMQAVSAIGRLRTKMAIPALTQVLSDNDPKVVCQAIRALLVFKGDKNVDNILTGLLNHENETVKSIIHKEYFDNTPDQKACNKYKEPYSPAYLHNTVVNCDVLKALKLIPDQSIHLTFTSPPYYNARDYSIYPSYEAYLDFLEEVFIETHRVTKDGRFLIVNTSPIIIPRVGRQYQSHRYPIPFDLHTKIVNNGWEFIDDIVWKKPEYSVKNRIGGFQQHRKPLAYKPNNVTEYLMVYRKKTDKLLDWNMRQYSRDIVEKSKIKGDFETSNVWEICPTSNKVHSAVFPAELCKRVILYYSYIGDTVFDPFAGSGTVGRVAKLLNRKFFLTEKELEYFEYMKSMQASDSFFDDNATKFLSLEDFIKAIDMENKNETATN